MKINLIVAISSNNGIGNKGDIPWHIKADMQYFSKLTKGNGNNAIVMGYNTWLSLPQQLPGLIGRDNFILSHNHRFNEVVCKDNRLIKTFGSYDEFKEYIDCSCVYDEVWIIGGAELYKTFLEKGIINKCYVTYIDRDFECDTFFPVLNPSEWSLTECRDDYDNKYNCSIQYRVYTMML